MTKNVCNTLEGNFFEIFLTYLNVNMLKFQVFKNLDGIMSTQTSQRTMAAVYVFMLITTKYETIKKMTMKSKIIIMELEL